jgi:hypothetical protein
MKRTLWLAVFLIAACTQPATVSTPTPLPCQKGELQQAGPWQVENTTYRARLTWETNADSACLMLLTGDEAQPVLLAHQRIAAGYSERYDEYYASALQMEPIQLDGQPPFIVTSRTAQGAGGGGGDVYEAWRPQNGELANVAGFSLESYTNINRFTETPCLAGAFFYQLVNDGLDVTSCFDGETQPVQRFEFDGQVFNQVEP